MISRCTNPDDQDWEYYGGRGITICPQWLNSVVTFAEDMGPRPMGMSLDRIDDDGNYEPGNCKWSTQIEQLANRRPYVIKPKLGNVPCLVCGEWTCSEIGICQRTAVCRHAYLATYKANSKFN